MGVTRLYGPIVVGVTRLEINLPTTLNIMYINFASKLASHMGDPSPPVATKFCFLKRGFVHCIILIHEVPKMWWLEYGFCFHEGVDHLIDVLVKHLRQVHVDPICGRHALELFIVSYPNCVVSDPLVITINCCPLFFSSQPIFYVCVMAKCHH